MLSITKVNNSIKVEGLDNKQFPDNGTLMIPLNSVILTLDESNIATFRSAANNDVLFSGVITDIQISGTPMTKQTITTSFTNIANSSGGGGGTVDAYTKAETDALLATKANESELSDYATVESLATVATSGSYTDLINKPVIPAAQIQSDWNQSDNSAADYIKNKPVNVSAFTNDAGYLTQHQSLADYSTTQEMNTAIATATNDMATMTWVGEQGYLTQHQDISDLFNGAEYDTQTKRINFKHGNTVLAYIDATAFIKDGMVSNVEVKNVTISGETVLCLVITFNTDAGKEPINIPISSIFDASNYYTKTEADNTFVKPADLATVATSGDYTDLSNTPNLATVATTGDYDDLTNKPTIPAAQIQSDWEETDTTSKAYIQNKPTIPTVPTNVSAFTNDAGYTTNTGTITGITMNGTSKGTSGVVDLGTVVTDISGKQDVIDSSHKLDADLVDDTTSTNKFVTASDKTTWSGKQDALVSGTNIKTINNESILGSGNITIQGGGSSYTAGDNIDITNDVISVDIDDEKKVIASALVELHNDKADKNQLNNYQLKGDYQTGAQVDAKITTATSTLRTEAEAINVEKVDAAALTDLNARVTDLEQGGGGSGITGITMNGSAVTVTSGVANLGTVVTDKSDKQDTLVSGTNIKTINNESILGSGNITISGGSDINVVQTTGTSTTDVMSQNAVTSTFLSEVSLNFLVNGRDTLALQNPIGTKNRFIPYMTINGKKVLSINDLSVVETSAITASITSSSTDSQVPSAKAVYDALQGGGGTQVQSDWNQTDTTAVDYIKNKPTIPTVPTTVSSFTNDAGYITSAALSSYYTKTEIDAMIGNISSSLDTINGEVI